MKGNEIFPITNICRKLEKYTGFMKKKQRFNLRKLSINHVYMRVKIITILVININERDCNL